MDYNKIELGGTLLGGADMGPPTGCLVLPTLDHSSKFFKGKAGYKSGLTSDFLPGVPSISGFFANSVVCKLNSTAGGASLGGESADANMLHGSSSHVIFQSKSKRPFYSPWKANKEDAVNAAALKAEEESVERQPAAEDKKYPHVQELWSLRSENGKPVGYMWEKETIVDRQQERVPLALLMSQTKAAMVDPKKPWPRDWIGVARRAGEGGKFDIVSLVKQLTAAGASAISVNSDGVLFGGSLEDITKAYVQAPPRRGDAVTLVPIASTVRLQVVASVTLVVEIAMPNKLGAGSTVALVLLNRDLETFDFDNSGQQALKLLHSKVLVP
ncbi:hypothetical protein ACHAWF_005964 [Thalassiosira exigua]